jgi:hypothetical protein
VDADFVEKVFEIIEAKNETIYLREMLEQADFNRFK